MPNGGYISKQLSHYLMTDDLMIFNLEIINLKKQRCRYTLSISHETYYSRWIVYVRQISCFYDGAYRGRRGKVTRVTKFLIPAKFVGEALSGCFQTLK